MEDNSYRPSDKIILNLSNVTQLTSFTIAITFTFCLVRLYMYYILLLHIPIFQYLDVTDIVKMAPNLIFWAFYVGAMESANFTVSSDRFERAEKIFFSIVLYAFVAFITWIGYHNDPVIEQVIKLPLRYWFYGIVPFLIYIYVMMKTKKSGAGFFKTNRYVAVFVFSIWYGIFDSFANYADLTKSTNDLHYIMKMKDGKTLSTSNNLIYAGRTSEVWFIYNRKTKFVRLIKNENIETIDFDTQ